MEEWDGGQADGRTASIVASTHVGTCLTSNCAASRSQCFLKISGCVNGKRR